MLGLKAQSIDYFSKQIDLCVDNKMFGTAWTNHTIMPGIEHKDKRPTRPSFKSDVSGKNRFFAGASSSTMEKYDKLWLSIWNKSTNSMDYFPIHAGFIPSLTKF